VQYGQAHQDDLQVSPDAASDIGPLLENNGFDEQRHSVCLKPADSNSTRKKLIKAHATERSSTYQSRNDCKMCDFCHILPGATI
jgi:hypothetical protein